MSGTNRNQERNAFLDGQIAQQTGDYLTRLERYEEAREQYQEARAAYEKLSPTSPDFEIAQNNQIAILKNFRNYQNGRNLVKTIAWKSSLLKKFPQKTE